MWNQSEFSFSGGKYSLKVIWNIISFFTSSPIFRVLSDRKLSRMAKQLSLPISTLELQNSSSLCGCNFVTNRDNSSAFAVKAQAELIFITIPPKNTRFCEQIIHTVDNKIKRVGLKKLLFQLFNLNSEASTETAYSCVCQQWSVEASHIFTNYGEKNSSFQRLCFHKIHCLKNFHQHINQSLHHKLLAVNNTMQAKALWIFILYLHYVSLRQTRHAFGRHAQIFSI